MHGLGGHAFNTWTHSGTGTFWIRDLLPDRLPGTRSFVFGFNARKKNHNAELDFEDVATQLVAGLSHFRVREEVSPLFIGWLTFVFLQYMTGLERLNIV